MNLDKMNHHSLSFSLACTMIASCTVAPLHAADKSVIVGVSVVGVDLAS